MQKIVFFLPQQNIFLIGKYTLKNPNFKTEQMFRDQNNFGFLNPTKIKCDIKHNL